MLFTFQKEMLIYYIGLSGPSLAHFFLVCMFLTCHDLCTYSIVTLISWHNWLVVYTQLVAWMLRLQSVSVTCDNANYKLYSDIDSGGGEAKKKRIKGMHMSTLDGTRAVLL